MMCGRCNISYLNLGFVVPYLRRPIKDHRMRDQVSAISLQCITKAAPTRVARPNQMHPD